MSIDLGLGGKVAFVTGASQGLGAATAEALAAAGARVAIGYWPDPDGANAGRAAAVAAGIGAEAASAHAADVRSSASVGAAIAAARERWGRIDILVNNAGIVRDRSFRKMSDEEWREVVETNLGGTFTACKAVEPWLEAGGRIVNVSSISGELGFFGQANYAASKLGVVGLTHVLARELAKRAITVNAVAPGLVLTDMGRTVPEAERARMLAQVPLARFGEPADVAGAIVFLCSALAAYVTGQTIHVNGGWLPS